MTSDIPPVSVADSNPPRRFWPLFRLVAAFALTMALIMPWGMVLVRTMLEGRIPRVNVVEIALGIPAVMALSAGLSARLGRGRLERRVLPAVGAVWCLAVGGLFFAFSGIMPQRLIVTALFVAASLWVVWSGWMFYRPCRWTVRLYGLAACLAATAAFPMLLESRGLMGDARLNFVWRRSAAPGSGTLLAAEAPARDETAAVDLSRTTPEDHPQFLGPTRTGIAGSAERLGDWTTSPPRERWRKRVGEAWSGFAVVGDYAVTQEQRGDDECVVCYRVSDGEIVWIHADGARFDGDRLEGASNMGGIGPRATPAIADGRVYSVGATGLLNCLDGATGKALWTVNIQADNNGRTIGHGVCGSPLVVDDRVIVSPTGNSAACVAAYNGRTGERLWQGGHSRDGHSASYSSPAVAGLAGTRQVLLYTEDGMQAHDLKTGAFLWDYTWTNSVRVNVAQPLIVDGPAGRVLVTTGYGTGSVLLEVAPGPAADAPWEVREIWKSPREMKTKFTTAVRVGNFVYGLDDGILACLDLADGKRKWKAGRYQHGQILLAGERLVVQSETGEVILVQPDPEKLIELGRIPALSGKTWNNPALAGRFLLVRNDHEAACYELPRGERNSSPTR